MLTSLLVGLLATGQVLAASCPFNSFDTLYQATATAYQPVYRRNTTSHVPDPIAVYSVGPFKHDAYLTAYPAGIGASTKLLVSSDGHSMYMGTTNGGVWKSDNFHQPHPGFKPLTDHMFCSAISTLAVSPSDWNYVAAGCGGMSNYAGISAELRGVLLSKDGGASWSETSFGSGRRIDALTILPPSVSAPRPTIVVAATHRRYRMPNGEYLLGNALTRAERRARNITGPFGSDGGIWLSNDDGVTWIQTFPRSVKQISPDPSDSNTLYMITFASYTGAWFYRSNDRGQTWKPFNDGMLLNTVAWEYEPHEYNDTYNFQEWPATGYGFPNRTHTIPEERPPLLQDLAFQPHLPYGAAYNPTGALLDVKVRKGQEHSFADERAKRRHRAALQQQGLPIDDDEEEEFVSIRVHSAGTQTARRRLLQDTNTESINTTSDTTDSPTDIPTDAPTSDVTEPPTDIPVDAPTSPPPRWGPDPSGEPGSQKIMWPRFVENVVISVHNTPGQHIVYIGFFVYNDLPVTNYLYDFYYSANGGPWQQFSDPYLDYKNVISLDQQGQTNLYLLADPVEPYIVYIGGTGTGRVRVDVRHSAREQSAWTYIAHGVYTEQEFEEAINNTLGIYSPHADARYAVYDTALDRLIETNDGGIFYLEHARTAPANAKWTYINGNYSNSEFMSVAFDWRSGTIGGGAQDNGIYISKPYTTDGDYYSLGSGDGEQVVFDTSSPYSPAKSYSSVQFMGDFAWNYLNDTIYDGHEDGLFRFDFKLMQTAITYVQIESREYAACNDTFNQTAPIHLQPTDGNITICYESTYKRQLIPHDRVGVDNDTHTYYYVGIKSIDDSAYWEFTTYFTLNRVNPSLLMACSISLSNLNIRKPSLDLPDESVSSPEENILTGYNACHRMSFGIYNKTSDTNKNQISQVMPGSLGTYTRDENGVIVDVTDYVFDNYIYGGHYDTTPYESFVIAVGQKYLWIHNPITESDTTTEAPWYVPQVPLNRQVTVKDLASHPHNLKHAYVTTSNSSIWHTRDMGVTWIEISNNLFTITGCREHPYTFGLTLVPINGTNITAVVVGTAFGLYYSFDHIIGANGLPIYNWAPLGTNFPNTLVSRMVYSPQADALIVATIGRGFWRMDRTQQYLVDILNGCYSLTLPQPLPAREKPYIPTKPGVISSTSIAVSSTGVSPSSSILRISSSSSTAVILRYTFIIYFRFPLNFITTKIIAQLTLELSRALGCSPSIIVIRIIINGHPLNMHQFHTLAASTDDTTPTPLEISFQPASNTGVSDAVHVEVSQAASAFRIEFAKATQDQTSGASIFSVQSDSLLSSLVASQGISETQSTTPYQDTIICADGTQHFTSDPCPTAVTSSSSSSTTRTMIVIIISTIIGIAALVTIIMLIIRHRRIQADVKSAENKLHGIAMEEIPVTIHKQWIASPTSTLP